MKSYTKFNWRIACIGLSMLSFQVSASDQNDDIDSTKAGSGLDLYGVMDLFKSAESIEGFEKSLNTEANNVNNLDLNNDNDIDYIQVIDKSTNDAHALVLRVAVNASEDQDMAVIEIEKNGDDQATLQIVGDEDMYGKEYIIEPYDENSNETPLARLGVRVVVNVWGWRPVRFMYAPVYRPWVSPYRWAVYPNWFRPWRPVAFYTHRNRCRNFRVNRYHRVRVHRNQVAHNHYRANRRTSAVAHRNHAARQQVNRSNQRNGVQKTNQRNKVNNNRSNTSRSKTNRSRRQTSKSGSSRGKTSSSGRGSKSSRR